MGSERPRGASGRARPKRPRPNETTDVIPAIEDDELAELDELDDENFDELDEGATGDPVADIDPDDEPDDRGYRLTAAGTPDRWSVLAVRASRFGRATVRRWAQLSAAVGGGLTMCLSYPPTGWWWASVVGVALLGWVLTLRSTTRAGGFGYGTLFGLAFYVPLLPWIASFVGAVPWLALAVVQALFCGLFGLSAVVVRALPGWPVWLAALWVAQEWLKSSVPFGGFPWGVVSFGQTNGPLLPIARLGGAPLLSFAVALVGFSGTLLALEVVQWWRHGHKPGFPAPAVMLPGLSITVVLLGTALLWPQVRHSGIGAGDEQTVTVAAVQGNVPRLGLEFNAQRRAVLDNHVKETQRLADDVRAGKAAQPMFVVWPENASDIDPMANADAAAQITAAADAIGAPILVGTVTKADGYTADNPVATNTVIVWDPEHGPGERHDKKIVQPFGEYLPWRDFFKHFSSYADRAGYFVPGEGNGVVHAAGVPIGVTTCWEVIFDRAAREAVRSGAQVLTVPTNNATFDENMSAQQLAFAKLRAVEHDRYVVVAGTTGISAVIAPDGRELARTEFFQPAYLDRQIRLKTELTPATEWGPVLQVVLVTVGLGAVGAALVVSILHNGGFVQRKLRRRTARARDDEGVS